MPVRSQEKGEEAVKTIEQANSAIKGAGSLRLMQLDLSSLDSVRQFAKAFKDQYKQLNILVNNAGAAIMAVHRLLAAARQTCASFAGSPGLWRLCMPNHIHTCSMHRHLRHLAALTCSRNRATMGNK